MENNFDPHFIEVDLDFESKENLTPIVDFFGDKVFVLYNDLYPNGLYHVALEAHPKRFAKNASPESRIRYLISLINELPPDLLKVWNRCVFRVFDIGIGSGINRDLPSQDGEKILNTYETDISEKTIRDVHKIKAKIRLTIYPYSND